MPSCIGLRARRELLGCAALLWLALAVSPVPGLAAGVPVCFAPREWFTGGVPALPTYEPRTDCQFEQWAWQSFLALLTTDASRTTAEYFTWDLPKPAIQNAFCERVCRSAFRAPKNPCDPTDTRQEVVNATTQPGWVAGGASGELIDQAGNPVYFTAHLNSAWERFVEQRSLEDPAVQAAAPADLGFPAGAFELKSSWRLADGMSRADRAQYFITTACIDPEDPAIAPYVGEVALVGFHITGGVPNHPELLWATFEHVRNAPDCDATPAPGDWAFYDGRADCRSGHCNRPNLAGAAAPINVCRQYPYGGASRTVGRQIAALNLDVQRKLPAGSVWRNYALVGTQWAADPTPDGVPTVNLQEPAGSPLLSNTSLETFKQTVGCFGCHNSQFPEELASFAASSPVIHQSKALFMSHVVLFPFFFAEAGCAATCPAPAAAPTSAAWH